MTIYYENIYTKTIMLDNDWWYNQFKCANYLILFNTYDCVIL